MDRLSHLRKVSGVELTRKMKNIFRLDKKEYPLKQSGLERQVQEKSDSRNKPMKRFNARDVVKSWSSMMNGMCGVLHEALIGHTHSKRSWKYREDMGCDRR
jgi:hypothetical protein